MRKVRGALSALEMECEGGELAGAPDGTAASIGQITIGCALGYLDFRYAELDWRAGLPRTADWFAQFDERPAMAATRPRERA